MKAGTHMRVRARWGTFNTQWAWETSSVHMTSSIYTKYPKAKITDEQLVQNWVCEYQGGFENMDFLQASLSRFFWQVHYLIFVGVSSKKFRWFSAELSELWSSQDRDFILESKLHAHLM